MQEVTGSIPVSPNGAPGEVQLLRCASSVPFEERAQEEGMDPYQVEAHASRLATPSRLFRGYDSPGVCGWDSGSRIIRREAASSRLLLFR